MTTYELYVVKGADMSSIPTLGFALVPWMDDEILTETFSMPNLKGLEIKGID